MELEGARRVCEPMADRKQKVNARREQPILSTGPGERMTAEQLAELRQLAQAAYEPEAFSEQLTRDEAAQRIAMLAAKLKLLSEPPHTI
jgi:hypothetical protein